MQLAPYLFFDGTCEAALEFYRPILGATTLELTRWNDAPTSEPRPPELGQRIMHATFVAPGITFMAADGMDVSGDTQRIALSIATGDTDEGRRVFEALADGGTVKWPYSKQFWGATFGMLVDRFGVQWMINAG